MPVIQYEKTIFRMPSRISEETYNEIRAQLMRNPNYEVDPNPETFSEHFSGLLMTTGISFLLFAIGFLVFQDDNPMVAVGGISMIVFFICLIYLFLEGPSFASYIKEKKQYYGRMKHTIQISSSYKEFVIRFY